ncbi:universal stress protein [uncultured Cellulomonas sp.]|uniref:universal stress protein n=1 Tax=uncultured Cellulomonas sp. TaxID=189682 RepID=UPI002632ABCA|nr:universal stress protein [uncultured Cellulomonas sp.]
MTIVVGYLATREGRAALDAAIAEAGRRSTRLLVVQSAKPAPPSEQATADAARQLEDLRRELDATGVPYDVRESSEGRDVAEDLIGAAEESDGTLIVIGLRRRSPVGKLILGVNAQRILLDAPCPVLAVKPGGNDDAEPTVRSS